MLNCLEDKEDKFRLLLKDEQGLNHTTLAGTSAASVRADIESESGAATMMQ